MSENYEAYFNIYQKDELKGTYKLFPRKSERWLIGRLKTCDIILQGHEISRQHATIRKRSGTDKNQYIIIDGTLTKPSKAGIIYEGKRIQNHHYLKNGDILYFPGNYFLEFGFRDGIILDTGSTMF